MPCLGIASSVLLAMAIMVALALPAFAISYVPGVTVGQYLKYGNFVGVGQGFETFNDYSWLRFEVTRVSGNEVTLLSTGQFKNGTAVPGNDTVEVWNVATGTENGVPNPQGPIIAANLNQGDSIPPPNTYYINQTKNAEYLGLTRSVNILNITVSAPDYNSTISYVYDKASGMLLEANSQTITQTPSQPVISTYSYSVIETNIFSSTTPSPTVQEFPRQIVVLMLIATIITAGVLAYTKKNREKGN